MEVETMLFKLALPSVSAQFLFMDIFKGSATWFFQGSNQRALALTNKFYWAIIYSWFLDHSEVYYLGKMLYFHPYRAIL